MEVMMVLSAIALTSAGGYFAGRSLLSLSTPRLSTAIWQMLGCLGTGVVFAVANVLIGATMIFTFRETTGTFVSIYRVDDATLILISVLQGIVFFGWYQLDVLERAAD